MSAKLKSELQKVKQRENAPIESVVDQVKTLLIGYDNESEKILKQAGLSSNPIEPRLTEDYKRTKAVEERYKVDSYTGAQIKELCNMYNLRMLPTSYYKGTVPADTADYIKDFCDKNKLPISDREMFILAPVEMFETKQFYLDRDPILFYRTDKRNSYENKAQLEDVFSQVHNWGNDFQETRKLWFLGDRHNRDFASNRARSVIFLAATLLFLVALITGIGPFIGITTFILLVAITLFSFTNISNLKNDEPWNTDVIYSSK
jgi:hypothetical protein